MGEEKERRNEIMLRRKKKGPYLVRFLFGDIKNFRFQQTPGEKDIGQLKMKGTRRGSQEWEVKRGENTLIPQ